MGIQGLTRLIQDSAPDAIKEKTLKDYTGRAVAIDASMALYQFLIAVRSGDGGAPSSMLTNDAGDVTSHLQGMLTRTIRLMDHGIKPIWVFDGAAPDMKAGELAKRRELKEKALTSLAEAEKEGKVEDIDKFSKRTVRVSREQNADVQKLLGLMGVPFVLAPGEAEAQCAAMARAGHVYAAASEDMDTLTFDTPRLLRYFTHPEAAKKPVLEISVDKILEGMEIDMSQFVDLCMLCGCDYLPSIKGVGPKTALKMVKEHGSIEAILPAIKRDKKKITVPDTFEGGEGGGYERARGLFHKPMVTVDPPADLKFKDCDEAGLLKFLCDENGFSRDRIESAIKRLKKARGKSSQKRMDSFFKMMPSKAPAKGAKGKGGKGPKGKVTGTKRKGGGSSSSSKSKKTAGKKN